MTHWTETAAKNENNCEALASQKIENPFLKGVMVGLLGRRTCLKAKSDSIFNFARFDDDFSMEDIEKTLDYMGTKSPCDQEREASYILNEAVKEMTPLVGVDWEVYRNLSQLFLRPLAVKGHPPIEYRKPSIRWHREYSYPPSNWVDCMAKKAIQGDGKAFVESFISLIHLKDEVRREDGGEQANSRRIAKAILHWMNHHHYGDLASYL